MELSTLNTQIRVQASAGAERRDNTIIKAGMYGILHYEHCYSVGKPTIELVHSIVQHEGPGCWVSQVTRVWPEKGTGLEPGAT